VGSGNDNVESSTMESKMDCKMIIAMNRSKILILRNMEKV
jgi:hypothetical protein